MNKFLFAGTIATFTAVLDQVTKELIKAEMPLWSAKTVIPDFFNLVHAVNRGAAFGFLNRADISWQRGFFIAVTIVALTVIYYLISSADKKEKLQITSLALLLGGAVGNLIDRIFYGKVTDFLDFYIGNYHWPAFNVADIALTVGAITMIASMYWKRPNASNSL